MSFASFLSNRLSLSDGVRRKWPPAIVVAVAGIAVSFTVMMLSIAVVSGFKSEIKRKIMGFDAQIVISPLAGYYGGGDATLVYDEALRGVVTRALAGVIGDEPGNGDEGVEMALSISQPGMLKTASDFMGVVFRGYGAGHGWRFEKSVLKEGELPDSVDLRAITVSESVARKLNLSIGDKIDGYFIVDGSVRLRKFEIKGIYSSNFSEYDDVVVYAPMPMLARLNKYGDSQGRSLEISGLGESEIAPVASRIQAELNSGFALGELPQAMSVTTVFTSGAIYFNWLGLLDTNVVVILILMGCVSGFSLISCVIILILQRVRMIGVLKSLGASNAMIRMVFIRLGIRVTFVGLLIGNVVSLTILSLQSVFHIVPLNPDTYYLSYVPVSTDVADWMALNAGVVAVAFIVLLLPTIVISHLSPVKTLRFE